MKYLFLTTFALLVPCCPDGYGAQPTDARTRAALALAHLNPVKKEQADCGCGGVLPCSCGPNCTCGFVDKKQPGLIERSVYLVHYNRAVAANKPLLVWIGEACPPCESAWTEFEHAHLSEYPAQSGTVTGPCVMVTRPNGLGGMTIAGYLQGIPSKAQVDALAAIPRQTIQFVPQQFNFVPAPMSMMPMMGNFGGGGCASCGR